MEPCEQVIGDDIPMADFERLVEATLRGESPTDLDIEIDDTIMTWIDDLMDGWDGMCAPTSVQQAATDVLRLLVDDFLAATLLAAANDGERQVTGPDGVVLLQRFDDLVESLRAAFVAADAIRHLAIKHGV